MSDAYKETITQVRDATAESLSRLTDNALSHAMLPLHQQFKHTGDDEKLLSYKAAVVERFMDLVATGFNDLLDRGQNRKSHALDLNSLSIIDTDVQDAHIALEGMAAHARNCDINDYLRFTIRINSQFYNARIDESNNPLDPGILAEAFKQAIRPLALSADALLEVYRHFNLQVLHQMGTVMQEANDLLQSTGVAPSLENLGRTRNAVANKRGKPRSKVDSNTRAFLDSEDVEEQSPGHAPEILNLLRGLLKTDSGNDPHDGEQAIPLNRKQLLQLLLEHDITETTATGKKKHESSASNFVSEILERHQEKGKRATLDQESADLIVLVDLLFKAIREDFSLPEAPRELINMVRLTVLHLILADISFFDNPEHPVRVLLDEMAAEGVSWTEISQLKEDPVYLKVNELVQLLVNEYNGDPELVDSLLEDFLFFKEQRQKDISMLEDRMINSGGSRKRLQDIERYALRKINERIVNPNTPGFIKGLLQSHYKRFLVKVILRDGPGGDSWKPVMDTCDLLLWSVVPVKGPEDRKLLEKINRKLLSNLTRALMLTGISESECNELVQKVKTHQQQSFSSESKLDQAANEDMVEHHDSEESANQEINLAEIDKEHLQSVRNLSIGMWFEFDVDETKSIQCTLATTVPSTDQYVFVNRQGIKVVDQSGPGLARDLHAQTARLVNDGKLIDRALDTVIAELRGGDA